MSDNSLERDNGRVKKIARLASRKPRGDGQLRRRLRALEDLSRRRPLDAQNCRAKYRV